MNGTNQFDTESVPQVFQPALGPAVTDPASFPAQFSVPSPSRQAAPDARYGLFPAFLKLDERSVLVVGAGKVGEQKIEGLLSTGAAITVVALEVRPSIQDWARAGRLTLHQRAFQPADLDGVFVVIVATQSRDLNEFIYREAQRQRVLCNVVDVPELCDFFYPAVVRRGDLQIAISTSGQSPSLAQRIRKQVEQQFGPNYAQWVEELGQTRKLILASDLPHETKQDLLHSLASREAFEAAVKKLRATGGSAAALGGSRGGDPPRQHQGKLNFPAGQPKTDLAWKPAGETPALAEAVRSSPLVARGSQEPA